MEQCRLNPKSSPNWYTYIALYVLFSIATLLQLIIYVPFSIYRLAIIFLVKLNWNRFGGILNSLDTIMADDFSSNKSFSSILCILEIQGNLTLANVKCALDKTLNLRDEKTREYYRFRKLHQYPANVFGYWFWKNEKNFEVKNHLQGIDYNRLVGDTEYNIETLSKIHQKLLNYPFPQARSPWNVTLIKNVKESNMTNSCKTLLAVRIHHCLGDGKSMVKLIVEGLGGSKTKTASSSKIVSKNQTIYSRICSFVNTTIMFFPTLVSVSIKTFLVKWSTRQHPWRVHNFYNDDSQIIVRLSNIIPMSSIKGISSKSKEQVSTSGIILTSIVESIKTALYPNDKFYSDDMKFLCTLPKPKHPNYLTNHFDSGILKIPNSLEGKYENVLKDINASYIESRDNDLENLCMRVLFRFVATLPRLIRSKLPLFSTFVKGVSNVAGNDAEFCIEGHPCTNQSMSVVLPKCSIGVVFLIFSYKRSLQVCVISKESVLYENKCQELADMIGIQIRKMGNTSFN